MAYKIKEAADIAGVSVRTLHHYDQIGLLGPESATAAGYRLYSAEDLDRLQQILFFKELEFSLREIKEIVDNPQFDRKRALLAQKELLIRKTKRLEAIINTVEKTIQSLDGGYTMDKKEMFQSFDMTEIEKYRKEFADEAEQKYGNTGAYKESKRKTSKYTKDDWAGITAEGNEIYAKIASLMDKEPSASDVQEAVGKWRQHITNNFYDCTLEIFRGLGDLYVDDKRFTKNIDKTRPGLARFMKDAICFYCDNHKN